MRAVRILAFAVAASAASAWPAATSRASDRITTPAEIERATQIESVRNEAGHVTGVLRNRSSDTLRDVRVLVQLVYHWPNEMHPGEPSPSNAVVAQIPGPLEPGQVARFDAALPTESAPGVYEPQAQVLGFTTIGR
jgi:hypothetical protein